MWILNIPSGLFMLHVMCNVVLSIPASQPGSIHQQTAVLSFCQLLSGVKQPDFPFKLTQRSELNAQRHKRMKVIVVYM